MRLGATLVLVFGLLGAAGCALCPGADEGSLKKAGSIRASDPGHYAEAEHDGRIYVIGDAKTEEGFAKMPHLQLSKTFIAAGPGGKTVIFEARDKMPEMTERLITQFNATHGLTLR